MVPILPPGTVLNVRYRVCRVVHQPGLSSVYHVQDQHMAQKSWAIREIYFYAPNQTAYVRTISFFQAEVLLTKKFEHPNLAAVVDYFNQNSAIYIVRNFIEGNDLAMAIQMRQLPETDILYIGMQVCDLLQYLCTFKERNFLPSMYKNLRLSNFVLGANGKVTLLDLCGSELRRNCEYCAPEQFTGTAADEQRTLVYNLGAMLYHLLTGLNPEECRFNLLPPDNYRLDLSRPTIQLITKATQNDSSNRFSSLSEFQSHLTKAYNAAMKKTGQKPKPLPSRSGKGKGAGSNTVPCLILVILMIIIALAAFVFLRGTIF